MINLKKAVPIILLALAMSTTFTVLSTTLALADDAQKQKAEALLEILEDNNVSILAAFSELETQNIPVPTTAETKYNQGLAYATEAANLLSADNFDEASIKAVEAMNLFKEALTLLQDASQTEPSGTIVAAENITRLKASLTQAFRYIERLENLTARANAAGYATTVLDANISQAKSHLETASDHLSNRNYDGAREELRAARALYVELKELVDRLTQTVKIVNVETYLQEAEDRLTETRDTILNSTDLSTQVRDDAIAALNTSEGYLDDARASLDNSNPDEAVSDIEEAKKWEDTANNVIASVTAGTNSSDLTNDSLTSTG
jgi:hypothetical protein